MPYTRMPPSRGVRPSADLRKDIPGWGVDLDVANRPAARKMNYNPNATGAHWEFPEQQGQLYPRERSIEHAHLTPVFGTSCPPRGVSGAIRRFAYRYSEGRLAHWLLLVFADRVDVLGSLARSALRGHPDNPLAEMGMRSELRHGGLRARSGRADALHVHVDVAMFAAKAALLIGGGYVTARALVRLAR